MEGGGLVQQQSMLAACRFQRNERCGFYFRLRKSPQQNEGGFYLHTMLSRDQVARVLLGLGYAARPDPEDTLPERHGGAPRLNDPPERARLVVGEPPSCCQKIRCRHGNARIIAACDVLCEELGEIWRACSKSRCNSIPATRWVMLPS